MSKKAQNPAAEAGQQALVPQLRFPEFRNAPGWDKQPLDKFLDYIQPTPYLVADTRYSDNYKTPVLTAGKTFLLGYTNEQHGIFNDGLPVIIFDDFTTATQFVDFPFKAKSSAMKILRPKNGANIKFMYETLKMISYEVGAHERHWISKFAPMQVPVPVDVKEQQKIADCLSSLDELIAAQASKVEALKAHKKGLMQLLFPAEGQTIPTLRFPEFGNAKGWEEISVSDFGDIVTGSTPSTSHPEFYGGGLPFVSPADISDMRFVEKTNTTLTTLGFGETRPVKANSVLFVCIGSTIGKVAQNIKDCGTNQQINSIVPNDEYSQGFVYYTLSFNADRIANLAGRQAVPIINKTQFSSVKVFAPKLLEQQKIADCLSSLDELIAAQAGKVEALKAHKKGLMQQLFPSSIDEDAI